jgi:pantoate--beta-alanine ligase
MNIVSTIAQVRAEVAQRRAHGQRIGLIPTMGYLHEGHQSLIQAAKRANTFAVCSIFVNPTQFAPGEDFDSYPRDADRDQRLLEQVGCDLLFRPAVEEMYPRPTMTYVTLDALAARLCGKSRPTHFRGVATIVAKLLHIVQPDEVFFGQKDGQQLLVIRRMVDDLNFPVRVTGVPTLREANGLAKSSRNIYLTPDERQRASVLYRALTAAKQAIDAGERDGQRVRQHLLFTLASEPDMRVDYAEVVDASTLEPLETIRGDVMMAVAVYVGKARLIDNFQFHVSG